MKAEMLRRFMEIVDSEVRSGPSAMEFELAYQVRVAVERIRFAIKHIECFAPPCPHLREANLQLLDALDRLDSVDRRFQRRSRISPDGNEARSTNQE